MNRPFPHQSPTRENDLRQPELQGEQRRATSDAMESECLAAILCDLHSVIGEVQQFLASFCDNWQQAQAESRVNLEKIAEEPEYSGDRALPTSQGLSEQAASLTEAWLRLEAEQREILQARAAESQITQQPPVQKKPEKPTLQRRQPPQKITASMPDHQMLSEFQLMRQEIVAARTITTAR